METKSFMSVQEVADVLGVSKSYAYKIVKQLNEELADVLVAADAVGIPILESCDNSKWHRWAARIRKERERKNICDGCFGASNGDCTDCERW